MFIGFKQIITLVAIYGAYRVGREAYDHHTERLDFLNGRVNDLEKRITEGTK